MDKIKLGLVMEGGGVKGAYQAGAIKALAELGVEFDGFAGTSIGALNSAVILQGGYPLLEQIWDEVSFCTVFDINDEMISRFRKKDFDLDMLFYAGKKLTSLREVIRSSYELSSEFLKQHVSEEQIRASGKDFGLVAYNLSDMKPVEVMKEDIEQGKLLDFVIASATFPIFPSKIIDDKKYIDGGVYDNMPINLLGAHGYDKMLVLRTNTASKSPKRKLARDDLDLFYIAPKMDLGLAMSFTAERVAALRNLGYHDCKAALADGLDKFLFDNEVKQISDNQVSDKRISDNQVSIKRISDKKISIKKIDNQKEDKKTADKQTADAQTSEKQISEKGVNLSNLRNKLSNKANKHD